MCSESAAEKSSNELLAAIEIADAPSPPQPVIIDRVE